MKASAAAGDVDAIRTMGTLFRFGHRVPQNFVAAADLHIIAALDGDVSARGELVAYLHEIENAALGGNKLAALVLAKMYDRGLGVEQDRVQTLAWVRWADARWARVSEYDDGVRSFREFYDLLASDEENRSATDLVEGRLTLRQSCRVPRKGADAK